MSLLNQEKQTNVIFQEKNQESPGSEQSQGEVGADFLFKSISSDDIEKAKNLIIEIRNDITKNETIRLNDKNSLILPLYRFFSAIAENVTWRYHSINSEAGKLCSNLSTDGSTIYICLDFVWNTYQYIKNRAIEQLKKKGVANDIAEMSGHLQGKLVLLFAVLHEIVHVARMHAGSLAKYGGRTRLEEAHKKFPYNIDDLYLFFSAERLAIEDVTNAIALSTIAHAIIRDRYGKDPFVRNILLSAINQVDQTHRNTIISAFNDIASTPQPPQEIKSNVWYYFTNPQLFKEESNGNAGLTVPTLGEIFESLMPNIGEFFTKTLPLSEDLASVRVDLDERAALEYYQSRVTEKLKTTRYNFIVLVTSGMMNIERIGPIIASDPRYEKLVEQLRHALTITGDRFNRYLTKQQERKDIGELIETAQRALSHSSAVPPSDQIKVTVVNYHHDRVFDSSEIDVETSTFVNYLADALKSWNINDDSVDPVCYVQYTINQIIQRLINMSIVERMHQTAQKIFSLVDTEERSANSPGASTFIA